MALQYFLARVFLSMLLLVCVTKVRAAGPSKVFDVRNYGAKADGKTDDSKSFLKAWGEACQWKGRARVLIPEGTYFIGSVTFIGPCKGSMTFLLRGNLKAPTGRSFMYTDQWIAFQYVDWLSVSGGGVFDGQGASAWPNNECAKNPNCQQLPTSVKFDFVTNARINYIRSVNSKNAHFSMFGCKNMNFSNIRISAPYDSPNTDGIKIGSSSQIQISRSVIGTGDDCISILSGSRDINISQVYCGPGHGISVGSLGKYPNENDVTGVTVKNCTFWNTIAGIRIKTWASPLASTASNFKYEDIAMYEVENPIIIDQQYCPHSSCNRQTQSHVQIKDITYRNIWGTSSSKVAITFLCSQSLPCKNIVLKDINLSHRGPKGPTLSWCSNIYGNSYGGQSPPSCL